MNHSIFQGAKRILVLAALALSLMTGSLVSQAIAAAGQGAPTFDTWHPLVRAAVDVQSWHSRRLMTTPGVVGTGIGIGADGRPVLRIFTDRAGIPDLPRNLAGIPVQLEVTGRAIALFSNEPDPAARYPRPVPIGISAGHPDVTAGTIGARVKDDAGNLYALSNNHVFADSNDTRVHKDSVMQPGSLDGGTLPADKIGSLYDYVPIDFSGGDNIVDAAIALTDSDLLGTATLSNGYGTPSSDTQAAFLDQPVQKCGRTTGCTSGRVTEISVTLNVCYEGTLLVCSKYALFTDQIGIDPGTFSAGGDSGSLIVTDDADRNPVALLFAGSSTRTFANPIDAVLSSFNVSIDGGETEPDAEEPVAITLIATGYKVKGRHRVDLEWDGTPATTFEVLRDGTVVDAVTGGNYTDSTGSRGNASYEYRVCIQDDASCSNAVTVDF
ncbi:S1 family peptidase [Marinobacterium rhizophilum]|uniref:Trypsin-like peptidase n=1 Tax=Marinobacterium rhizophilum TaxID=420402 RepID=A0ABY5HGT5_9GAMM|nr:S1 family peptidase [Marinobacterium rhizophilum]UTW11580.1 hypothetical protein KDW95_20395 [Marinobacterium rhizophilum]